MALERILAPISALTLNWRRAVEGDEDVQDLAGRASAPSSHRPGKMSVQQHYRPLAPNAASALPIAIDGLAARDPTSDFALVDDRRRIGRLGLCRRLPANPRLSRWPGLGQEFLHNLSVIFRIVERNL